MYGNRLLREKKKQFNRYGFLEKEREKEKREKQNEQNKVEVKLLSSHKEGSREKRSSEKRIFVHEAVYGNTCREEVRCVWDPLSQMAHFFPFFPFFFLCFSF